MLCNQFGVNLLVPCIPQVQRILMSQLCSGVAPDLQKGDEDEGSAVGGDEISM